MENTNKDLLPFYLAVGSDMLKIEAVIRRMNDRLNKIADMTMDKESFDASQAETEQIIEACEMFPVFAPKRLVLVKNTDKITSHNSEKLIEYLKNPNATTILLLTTEKMRKSNKIFKFIQSEKPQSIINCEPPKARDLSQMVIQYARQNGVTIDLNAATKLIELIGQDTVALNSEIKKIASSSQNYRITINDIMDNTVRSTAAKPWDFTDAILQRDLKKALSTLKTFEQGCEYRLLPATCNTIKELICVQSIGASANQNKIAKQLGMPANLAWKYKNHIRYARNYSRSELRKAIFLASKCDAEMKSTSDSFAAFERFIITIISREDLSSSICNP